jgi:hypothetical protein
VQLIYPTLDLFLYDLRDELGQTSEKVKVNRANFQSRLPNLTAEQLAEWAKLERDSPDLTNPIELLGSDRLLAFPETEDGYYWPVQLSDTYALQVNCSVPKLNGQPNTTPQDLTVLPDLQASLNQKIQHRSGVLGQTWILWAQLSDRPSLAPVAKVLSNLAMTGLARKREFPSFNQPSEARFA